MQTLCCVIRMLRLVRQDEPTKPSIPYAERTFTERKAQHAAPNQVGDIMRAAAGRELWGNVTYSNAGILRLQRILHFRLQCKPIADADAGNERQLLHGGKW